jgi:adenylate cyclase class IV
MIEVEIRGEIVEFDKLLKNFRSKAKFVKEKNRLSLIYCRYGLDKDINSKEVKEDPVDLRLRITNKQAEMILKYGRWGAEEQRHEISIPISLEQFEEAADFLKYLGWDKGIVTSTDTLVFNYKEIEFALVKTNSYNYFEAEILAKSKEDVEKAKSKIINTLKELNLKPMTEEEMTKNIDKMNKSSTQFDFRKEDFSKIKKAFPNFFTDN